MRSPFVERVSAPRQPSADEGARATIELDEGKGYEDALEGLEGFEYLWVVFVFHRNVEDDRGWRPKVLPPRSEVKRGVFATRSPHRPNAIGLSVVRLDRIEGLTLHVSNVDILDGTPVLDIKPYIPYADAYPDAKEGWLDVADPKRAWEVAWSEPARAARDLLASCGVDLAEVDRLLALGPQPHAYRRIRKDGERMRLAYKEWRVFFRIEGSRVTIEEVRSGYRASQIAADQALATHARLEAWWKQRG